MAFFGMARLTLLKTAVWLILGVRGQTEILVHSFMVVGHCFRIYVSYYREDVKKRSRFLFQGTDLSLYDMFSPPLASRMIKRES